MIPRTVRTRVYIAGPISIGDVAGNIARGIAMGEHLIELGYAPIVPHLDIYAQPKGLAGTDRYEWALDMDFSFISVCHALLRLSGPSKGADREVEWAKRIGIPVYHDLQDLLDVWPPQSPLILLGKPRPQRCT